MAASLSSRILTPMRCTKCNEYIPDGIGFTSCPKCGFGLAEQSKHSEEVSHKVTDPPKKDSQAPGNSEMSFDFLRKVKTNRDSLIFLICLSLAYSTAIWIIDSTEYMRTLSMAGLRRVAYAQNLREFLLLNIIGFIIYWRAIFLVGISVEQLRQFKKIKMARGWWVFFQIISPIFFKTYGMAFIPIYLFFVTDDLTRGKSIEKTKKDKAYKRVMFFLVVMAVVVGVTIFMSEKKNTPTLAENKKMRSAYYHLEHGNYQEAIEYLDSKNGFLTNTEWHQYVEAYEGLKDWTNAFGRQVALIRNMTEMSGENYHVYKLLDLYQKKNPQVKQMSTKEKLSELKIFLPIDNQGEVFEGIDRKYKNDQDPSDAFLLKGRYFHKNLRLEEAENFYRLGLLVIERDREKIHRAFSRESFARQHLIDLYILREDYKLAISELKKIIEIRKSEEAIQFYRKKSNGMEKHDRMLKELDAALEALEFADQHSFTIDKFQKVFDTVIFYRMVDTLKSIDWVARYKALEES